MFFGRTKNIEIKRNIIALENVATELSGVFDIVFFFKNILETNGISDDEVHPSVNHGMPNLVRSVWNFYVHHGLTVFETEIKPRIINRNNFGHFDNNIFLVSIQNKHLTSKSLLIWLTVC